MAKDYRYMVLDTCFRRGARFRPGSVIVEPEKLDPCPRYLKLLHGDDDGRDAATSTDGQGGAVDATNEAIIHAQANGIDLNNVQGTGQNGRITKGNVQAYINSLAPAVAPGYENEAGTGQQPVGNDDEGDEGNKDEGGGDQSGPSGDDTGAPESTGGQGGAETI